MDNQDLEEEEEEWTAAEWAEWEAWKAWQDWGASGLMVAKLQRKAWRPRGARGGDWLRRAWRAGLPSDQMRQLVKYRAQQSANCDRRHGYWQDYTGCNY